MNDLLYNEYVGLNYTTFIILKIVFLYLNILFVTKYLFSFHIFVRYLQAKLLTILLYCFNMYLISSYLFQLNWPGFWLYYNSMNLVLETIILWQGVYEIGSSKTITTKSGLDIFGTRLFIKFDWIMEQGVMLTCLLRSYLLKQGQW